MNAASVRMAKQAFVRCIEIIKALNPKVKRSGCP